MLTVTASQIDLFQGRAESAFARELREALAEKYVHMLPGFPEEVQDRIVCNMLDRARRWGVSWQSSLAIFAEFMLSIAANFDEQTQIRIALEQAGPGVDSAVKDLPELVPGQAWERAEAAAVDLPYFVPGKLLSASLVEQTAAAIPLILHDFKGRINALELAQASSGLAASLNLAELRDAPLVLAVCVMFYGREFYKPRATLWSDDVFRDHRSPREALAMLKFRIGLDHGRYI